MEGSALASVSAEILYDELDFFDLGPFDRKKYPRQLSKQPAKRRTGDSVKSTRKRERVKPKPRPIPPAEWKYLLDAGYTKKAIRKMPAMHRLNIITNHIPPHLYGGKK